MRIEGQINGVQVNRDTVVNPGFIEYEHTHGANYWMINFVKRNANWKSIGQKHFLSILVKPGLGIVIPHSYTKLFGQSGPGKYHVAGYMAGVEGGLRGVLFNHLLLEFTIKGAYANYRDVLLAGSGRARQQWWSFQYIMLIGLQTGLAGKAR